MPAPHRSVFYRPDALPAAQPTVSEHLSLTKTSKYFMRQKYDKSIMYHLKLHSAGTCAMSAASSSARLCVTGNLPATISPFI